MTTWSQGALGPSEGDGRMADSTQTPDPDSSQEIPPASEKASGRRRRRVAGAPAGAPAPTVAPEPAADPAASAVRRTTVPEQSETVPEDRKSTRLNSSHVAISYAVFCLKKKKKEE